MLDSVIRGFHLVREGPKAKQIRGRTLEHFQERWEPTCIRKHGCAHSHCGSRPTRRTLILTVKTSATARLLFSYCFLVFALLAAVPGAAGAVAAAGLRLGCAFGAAGRIGRAA